MDYDLADYAASMSPADRQMMEAKLLRKRQSSQALQDASARGNRFNNMAAIAQMSGNEGAAEAAGMAAKNAQSQNKVQALGTMGFAIPGTGEFVSSPMYEDEKDEQRKSRLDVVRAQGQERLQAARERMDSMAQENERNRQLRMTLGTMMEQGRNDRASDAGSLRETLAAMKGGAGKPGKTLPAGEVAKLTNKQAVASAYQDLADSFQDNYTGTPVLASAQNLAGRFGVSKYGEQANWWQNYQDQTNRVRHELFGSALTAPEKAAFDQANIVPGMDSKQVRTRLAQQNAAATRASQKLASNYGKAGYDMSGFGQESEAQPGPMPGGAPRGGAPAAAAPAGFQLPPGFKVIGEAKQ